MKKENLAETTLETVDYRKMCVENQVEVLEFDGVEFEYHYFMDQNGNQSTRVINRSTGKEDVLTYKENSVLLNSDEICTICKELTPDKVDTKAMNEWINSGVYHKKITWKSSAEGTLLLSLISTAMSLKQSLVKASAGIDVFNAIANYCNGGTLHYSAWYYVSLVSTIHRYDWSFAAASGKIWGTYHVQFNEY